MKTLIGLCAMLLTCATATATPPAGFDPEGKVSGSEPSRDGKWMAYAGSMREGRRVFPAIALVELGGPGRRVVPLINAERLSRARLVEVDVERERVLLTDKAGSELELDLDGQIVRMALREPEIGLID